MFLAAMDAFVSALSAPAVAVAAGCLLRRTGAFTTVDGQTATKYMTWLTLPSLILQSFNRAPLQPLTMAAVVGSAVLVGSAAATISWLINSRQHPKERGLLSGSAVGAGLAVTAYPVVQAVFGQEGLRLALVWGLANNIAVWVGSFLLFASAGAAFPDQYEHVDGGTYCGEWKGMLKDGFGVYSYPSGARYEGEWIDNLKEGRGVYYFPRGGVYEGEWRQGKMVGVGVRTFASGKVQAGVWRDGSLESGMEERQCALAVEGANEAAAVARRVQVGAGTLKDAAAQLLTDPTTWAYAAAVVLAVLQRPLTPTLDVLTRQLSAVHAPLGVLALGLTLDTTPPHATQEREVMEVLAVRLLLPLLLAAAAAAVLGGPLGWDAAKVVALVGPLLLCAVAPVAPQVQGFAYRFRLNENLAAALARTTTTAAVVLMPLLAAALVLSTWAASLRPLLLALGAATASVGVAAAASLRPRPSAGQQSQRLQSKVRMVYAGPTGEGPSAGGATSSRAAPPLEVDTPSLAGPTPTEQQAQQSSAEGSAAPAARPVDGAGALESSAASQEPPQQQQQQQPQRQASAFQDVERADSGTTSIDGGSGAGGTGGKPQAAAAMQPCHPLARRQWCHGLLHRPAIRRQALLPQRAAAARLSMIC